MNSAAWPVPAICLQKRSHGAVPANTASHFSRQSGCSTAVFADGGLPFAAWTIGSRPLPHVRQRCSAASCMNIQRNWKSRPLSSERRWRDTPPSDNITRSSGYRASYACSFWSVGMSPTCWLPWAMPTRASTLTPDTPAPSVSCSSTPRPRRAPLKSAGRSPRRQQLPGRRSSPTRHTAPSPSR